MPAACIHLERRPRYTELAWSPCAAPFSPMVSQLCDACPGYAYCQVPLNDRARDHTTIPLQTMTPAQPQVADLGKVAACYSTPVVVLLSYDWLLCYPAHRVCFCRVFATLRPITTNILYCMYTSSRQSFSEGAYRHCLAIISAQYSPIASPLAFYQPNRCCSASPIMFPKVCLRLDEHRPSSSHQPCGTATLGNTTQAKCSLVRRVQARRPAGDHPAGHQRHVCGLAFKPILPCCVRHSWSQNCSGPNLARVCDVALRA